MAGVSFEGNTFFYPNPLEVDGVTKFNQGVCGRSPWFDCSCCPVNVVRVFPSLPGYIYATNDKEVYVNLYIGNNASFKVGDRQLKVSLKTSYPWDGNVELAFTNEEIVPAQFKLRIPGWVRNEVMPGDLYSYADDHKPGFTISVNGKDVNTSAENGYIILDHRNWQSGDKINISFDMPLRKVVTHNAVKANTGKMAFEKGPLVYCAEEIDNAGGVLNAMVPKEGDLNFAIDPNLFGGLGKISNTGKRKAVSTTIKLIPYYAWAHREIGEMAVWLKAE